MVILRITKLMTNMYPWNPRNKTYRKKSNFNTLMEIKIFKKITYNKIQKKRIYTTINKVKRSYLNIIGLRMKTSL